VLILESLIRKIRDDATTYKRDQNVEQCEQLPYIDQ